MQEQISSTKENEAESKSRLSVLCSSRVTDPMAQECQSRTGLEWNLSHWTDLLRNPHKGLACRVAGDAYNEFLLSESNHWRIKDEKHGEAERAFL